MSDWLPRLLVRRLILLWVAIVATMILVWFTGQETINEPQADVIQAVLLLLGVATSFYTHKRHQDDD